MWCLFLGTNDMRREAPADQVIAGIKDIVRARVKQKGIEIIGVIRSSPRDTIGSGNPRYRVEVDAKTKIRNEDRSSGSARRAARRRCYDFDGLVRDRSDPDVVERGL